MRSLSLVFLVFIIGLSACAPDPAETPYTPKRVAFTALTSAQEALRAGDTQAALGYAATAAEEDPRYDDAVWLYATLLGRTARYAEALEILAPLCERSPDLVQAHMLQGILWDRRGDAELANRAYDRALERLGAQPDPSKPTPSRMLLKAVTTFLRHGKLEGVQSINDVLEAYPDFQPALFVKSGILEHPREYLMGWFTGSDDSTENKESSAALLLDKLLSTEGDDAS